MLVVCSWYANKKITRPHISATPHPKPISNTKPKTSINAPNPKQFHQDEKICQSSSAAHSRPFEISHSRKTVEFFHPKAAIIHAHSAKPILNQNNQTNLTRYVSLSRVSSYPIRSPTATLYQKKPTRVLRFWKTLEVRSSRSPIITSSSFCRINLLSSTNLFRAKLRQVRQVRVFSRSVCSRGLRECGGCGGCGRVWACGFY